MSPCRDPAPSATTTSEANFGFNFTCEVETAKKRTVIKGEITYHDGPTSTVRRRPSDWCYPGDQAPRHCETHHYLGHPSAERRWRSCSRCPPDGRRSRAFRRPCSTGTYRSQDTTLSAINPVASSPSWWATRVSRAARAGTSPGTSSPSNSSLAPTPRTPGAATSRAATSRWIRLEIGSYRGGSQPAAPRLRAVAAGNHGPAPRRPTQPVLPEHRTSHPTWNSGCRPSAVRTGCGRKTKLFHGAQARTGIRTDAAVASPRS